MKFDCDNDFRPVPFWFLNHRLERGEMERQVALMAEAGCGGFFMHPRSGLQTPYGSEEWFEAVGWAIAAAEKHGIHAWLYDEDPYPSGAVGGRMFFDHPEFAARQMRFFEGTPGADGRIELGLGTGRVLTAVALKLDAAGQIVEERDLAGYIGVVRPDYYSTEWRNSYFAQITGKQDYFQYRAECFNPELRLAAKLPAGEWRVLCVTAEVAPGTEKFGAMPDLLNPACTRYFIEHVHEEYFRRFGDKFGSVIPGIFTDEASSGVTPAWTAALDAEFDGKYHWIFSDLCGAERAREIRIAYQSAVDRLFAEHYFKPLHDWCREHRLLLVGHCGGEENLGPSAGGSCVALFQEYFDAPGFDHITANLPDGEFQSLNFGGKLVATAAHRAGARRIISECFGCNAFNFGFDGMKRNANWLFSLGVNTLVPHGFYYSYDGFRKQDAGRSFFFQHADFARFGEFAAYAARVGRRLAESEAWHTVCLAIPLERCRAAVPGTQPEALADQLYGLTGELLRRHIQFDISHEPEKGVYEAILRPGDAVDFARLKPLNGAAELSGDPVTASLRRSADGVRLYLFNHRLEPSRVRLHWLMPGAASVYDPERDRQYRCDRVVELTLAPGQALFAECGVAVDGSAPEYAPDAARPAGDFAYLTRGEWDFVPDTVEIAAALTHWEVTTGGESFGKRRYGLLRDWRGTELTGQKRRPRPIFDCAPVVPSIYPCNALFQAEFTLETVPDALWLLGESESLSGDCEIRLNGTPIPPFVRRRVYDAWNVVSPISALCRAGRNTVELRWRSAGEFAGLRSALYCAVLPFRAR